MGMMRSSMFGITRIFCKEESRITNQWLSTLQGYCLEVTWQELRAQSWGCELEVTPRAAAPGRSWLWISGWGQAGIFFLCPVHLYGCQGGHSTGEGPVF